MSSTSAAIAKPPVVLVQRAFADRHSSGSTLIPLLQAHDLSAGAVTIVALRAEGHAPQESDERISLAAGTHVSHVSAGLRPRSNATACKLAYWQERRAKELLAANVTGNISLADLAKACELSIRHFTRAFRASTGVSARAWLLHLRIAKAKTLLMSSRRVLAEIALECGFADQSHFSRMFQRSVGISPGAWQRLHRR